MWGGHLGAAWPGSRGVRLSGAAAHSLGVAVPCEDGDPLVLSICERGRLCMGRKLGVANCIVIRCRETQGCFVLHLPHE